MGILCRTPLALVVRAPALGPGRRVSARVPSAVLPGVAESSVGAGYGRVMQVCMCGCGCWKADAALGCASVCVSHMWDADLEVWGCCAVGLCVACLRGRLLFSLGDPT